MEAVDAVYSKFGRNSVRTVAQTVGGVAKLTHQNALSPSYTTKSAEMLRINVGIDIGHRGGVNLLAGIRIKQVIYQ